MCNANAAVGAAAPRPPLDASGREDRRKHLELIQGVINRLAGASFKIKGWTVTIATALLGVVVAGKLPTWVAWVGVAPACIFWFLDSYLRQERLFRALYRDATKDPPIIDMFSMCVVRYTKTQQWTARVAVSQTVWPVHIVILLIVVLFGFGQFRFLWPRPDDGKAPANQPAQVGKPDPGK